MADRVKYFLLGVLFLLVAGVIAYDRWNSPGDPEAFAGADSRDGSDVEISVGTQLPLQVPPEPSRAERGGTGSRAERAGRRPPADPNHVASPRVTPAGEGRTLRATPGAGPRFLPDAASSPRRKEPAATSPRKGAKEKSRVHVIRKGETLETIALRYYRTRKGVAWIVAANNLSNPNRIFTNQKLVIPARKELTPQKRRTVTTVIPSRYVVKVGDGDLYAICRRFYGRAGEGARVARIMELNKLWSAAVKPGTVLMLPKK